MEASGSNSLWVKVLGLKYGDFLDVVESCMNGKSWGIEKISRCGGGIYVVK